MSNVDIAEPRWVPFLFVLLFTLAVWAFLFAGSGYRGRQRKKFIRRYNVSVSENLYLEAWREGVRVERIYVGKAWVDLSDIDLLKRQVQHTENFWKEQRQVEKLLRESSGKGVIERRQQ